LSQKVLTVQDTKKMIRREDPRAWHKREASGWQENVTMNPESDQFDILSASANQAGRCALVTCDKTSTFRLIEKVDVLSKSTKKVDVLTQ
jgi:hypothetical protein